MLSHISNRPRVAYLVLVTLISRGMRCGTEFSDSKLTLGSLDLVCVGMWERNISNGLNKRNSLIWCVRKKSIKLSIIFISKATQLSVFLNSGSTQQANQGTVWIQSRPPISGGNWIKMYLFFNQNKCCGCSEELSHWDGSFENPKYRIVLIGKIFFLIFNPNICCGYL